VSSRLGHWVVLHCLLPGRSDAASRRFGSRLRSTGSGSFCTGTGDGLHDDAPVGLITPRCGNIGMFHDLFRMSDDRGSQRCAKRGLSRARTATSRCLLNLISVCVRQSPLIYLKSDGALCSKFRNSGVY
jgi:hypothetical protein